MASIVKTCNVTFNRVLEVLFCYFCFSSKERNTKLLVKNKTERVSLVLRMLELQHLDVRKWSIWDDKEDGKDFILLNKSYKLPTK